MIGNYIQTIQTEPNTQLALLRLAVTHSDRSGQVHKRHLKWSNDAADSLPTECWNITTHIKPAFHLSSFSPRLSTLSVLLSFSSPQLSSCNGRHARYLQSPFITISISHIHWWHYVKRNANFISPRANWARQMAKVLCASHKTV